MSTPERTIGSLLLPARAQARKDFKGGGGQEDNPYPKNTVDHEVYKWEMAELWSQEMKDLRAEIVGGV